MVLLSYKHQTQFILIGFFYGVNHFYITLEQYSQNTDISMLWVYSVKKHIIIQSMRDTG